MCQEPAPKMLIYFYSRPCGRGDGKGGEAMRGRERFLLTPLREGRHADIVDAIHVVQFLLTPLREGRPTTAPCPTGTRTFLLTPLREGRRFSSSVFLGQLSFLLTPLREGRLVDGQTLARVLFISTHAPAGGATTL